MTTTAQAPTPAEPQATEPAREKRGYLQQVLDSSTTTIVVAIVIALILASLLVVAADPASQKALAYVFARPGDFFGAAWDAVYSTYSALFRGAIFDPQASGARQVRPITETMVSSVPLIFAGLGLGIGFRSGLFNIGAQGQVLIGAAAGAWVGFAVPMPAGLHVLVVCVAAAVAGGVWAGIAGFLKARTGASEVIVTIMLNSIAAYLVAYLLTTSVLRQPGSTRPITPPVKDTAVMPLLLGDQFRLHLGFVLAILAAVGVWWLMERSTLGFRFRAVGANQDAARTAGIKVTTVYVLVMLVAGGLAGLGGAMQIVGTDKTFQASSAGSIGFDAITVALLGRSRPLGTVLAALLFGALRAGSPLMQTAAGTPIDLVLVIQAVIVLLIAAPPLVRELSLVHWAAVPFGYDRKKAAA